MPLSRSRDYLSIGEVLDTLSAEFDDVSISKIRFLESEGLIDPERTASGYRKFFERDVARLRYILSLQRDHFLPLKVIRERLAQADSNGGAYPAEQASVVPDAPTGPAAGVTPGRAAQPAADLTSVQLDRAGLQAAAGLSEAEMVGLEEFGILAPGATSYDGHDLVAATAARGFFAFGVEPRHLRMYRQIADREAAFFEQIVSPVAARRGADAHDQASRSVRELIDLSRRLRDAVLTSSLRDIL